MTTDATTTTDNDKQASKDPTDFEGKPTLRYKLEGDEYLARAIDEDGGYVHQFSDGSDSTFQANLPSDATIVATENGDNQVLPDG